MKAEKSDEGPARNPDDMSPEEVKQLLGAYRQSVLEEILRLSDLRDWCEDGTRETCAGLRIRFPADARSGRKDFNVHYTLTVNGSFSVGGWTEKSIMGPNGPVEKETKRITEMYGRVLKSTSRRNDGTLRMELGAVDGPWRAEE